MQHLSDRSSGTSSGFSVVPADSTRRTARRQSSWPALRFGRFVLPEETQGISTFKSSQLINGPQLSTGWPEWARIQREREREGTHNQTREQHDTMIVVQHTIPQNVWTERHTVVWNMSCQNSTESKSIRHTFPSIFHVTSLNHITQSRYITSHPIVRFYILFLLNVNNIVPCGSHRIKIKWSPFALHSLQLRLG